MQGRASPRDERKGCAICNNAVLQTVPANRGKVFIRTDSCSQSLPYILAHGGQNRPKQDHLDVDSLLGIASTVIFAQVCQSAGVEK